MATAKKAAKRTAPAKKAAKKGAARAVPAKKAAKKGAKKGAKKAAPKRAAAKRSAAPAKKPAPPPKSRKAPVRWILTTDSSGAFGVYASGDRVWMSNDSGDVHVCDLHGEVQRSLKLPYGAKCIIADEHWIYAGTNKGVVYDLTGNSPRAVYQVDSSAEILWLDIYQGNLCVAADNGTLSVYDPGEVLLWADKSKPEGSMWMVRGDKDGVYVGGSKSVRAFDWGGAKRWSQPMRGVMFGVQTERAVYASNSAGATGFTKDGKKLVECKNGSFPSCATTPDGSRIFGGTWSDAIDCFDADGKLLWTLETGCDSALSMQYLDEVLYIVTSDGSLAAIDVSHAAIEAALAGNAPKPKKIKAPHLDPVDPEETARVETTKDVGDGVLVECFKEKGKLRVRVLSAGYKSDWFVQFPRDIREAGAKYVVDKVLEATQGGFYRALGNIRRLQE
ncbi:MAG: PQQ-binding-like beta-propeller repeat protein [Polyangiales bacterium]